MPNYARFAFSILTRHFLLCLTFFRVHPYGRENGIWVFDIWQVGQVNGLNISLSGANKFNITIVTNLNDQRSSVLPNADSNARSPSTPTTTPSPNHDTIARRIHG